MLWIFSSLFIYLFIFRNIYENNGKIFLIKPNLILIQFIFRFFKFT